MASKASGSLNLPVQPFQWIRAVQLPLMLEGQVPIRQHGSAASSSSAAALTKRARRSSGTFRSCASADARSGCATRVRTIATAASRAHVRHGASGLRMKRTRQRCDLVPFSTVLIACA